MKKRAINFILIFLLLSTVFVGVNLDARTEKKREIKEMVMSYPVEDENKIKGFKEFETYLPYYGFEKVKEVRNWYEFNKNKRLEVFGDLPVEIANAVIDIINNSNSDFIKNNIYRVTSSRVEGDWALLSLSVVNDKSLVKSKDLYTLNTSLLLRREDNIWTGFLECEKGYENLLEITPEKFIEKDSKVILINFCNQNETV